MKIIPYLCTSLCQYFTVLTCFLIVASVSAGDYEAPPVSDLSAEAIDITSDDAWEFTLRPFLWTASTEGDIGAGEFIAPIDISFKDVIDSLNFSAAGSFTAQKGPWSFYLEGLYIETGPDLPSLPVPLFSIDGITVTQGFASGLIGYRLKEWDKGYFEIGAGARYTYFSNELELSLGPNRSKIARTVKSNTDYVDPLIGFSMQHDLTKNIYVNFAGDIGGFGVNTNLFWDLVGGVGYRWTDRVATEFYYRYQAIDYDDAFIYDVTTTGLFLGLAIDF